MSERTSYAPGVPCWVDLGSPDLDASVEFYSALFGWQVPESENVEQTGGYRRATKNGRDVAGMMPLMQEGQPPAWSSYVAVADADATAAAVKEAGGSVLAEPMDVMELGRMAVFADPSGAVFGWGFEENQMGENETYTMITLDGNPVGGILDLDERGVPAEIPVHWLVYFAVEDTDATIAQAKERGANVMMEPIDLPVGRFAILTDPHGAAFAVIALSESAPPA